jgi:hypothetical protein
MIPLADIIASGSLRRSSAKPVQRRSGDPYHRPCENRPPAHGSLEWTGGALEGIGDHGLPGPDTRRQ